MMKRMIKLITWTGLCRYRQTAKISKAMSGPAAEVLATLRSKLVGFQEHLPLIKALRNPGLRDRHWDKISQSKTSALCTGDAVTMALSLMSLMLLVSSLQVMLHLYHRS